MFDEQFQDSFQAEQAFNQANNSQPVKQAPGAPAQPEAKEVTSDNAPDVVPEIADEVVDPAHDKKMNPKVSMEPKKKRLVELFAEKYGVESDKLLNTLKATVFRQPKDNGPITNEQMMTLLVVAHEYNLNPFTKEIYAFPDKGGIVPVVGIDGWSRIINEHPQLDGIEFVESENMVKPDHSDKTCFDWVECRIYRKDRTKPVSVKEYLDEVYRPPFSGKGYEVKGPWQSHPKRMLRHKALIQCARIAFGFTGIKDEDEAQRIIENDMGPADVVNSNPQGVSAATRQNETPKLGYSHLDEFVSGLRKHLSKLGLEQCMVYAKSQYKNEDDLKYIENCLANPVQ